MTYTAKVDAGLEEISKIAKYIESKLQKPEAKNAGKDKKVDVPAPTWKMPKVPWPPKMKEATLAALSGLNPEIPSDEIDDLPNEALSNLRSFFKDTSKISSIIDNFYDTKIGQSFLSFFKSNTELSPLEDKRWVFMIPNATGSNVARVARLANTPSLALGKIAGWSDYKEGQGFWSDVGNRWATWAKNSTSMNQAPGILNPALAGYGSNYWARAGYIYNFAALYAKRTNTEEPGPTPTNNRMLKRFIEDKPIKEQVGFDFHEWPIPQYKPKNPNNDSSAGITKSARTKIKSTVDGWAANVTRAKNDWEKAVKSYKEEELQNPNKKDSEKKGIDPYSLKDNTKIIDVNSSMNGIVHNDPGYFITRELGNWLYSSNLNVIMLVYRRGEAMESIKSAIETLKDNPRTFQIEDDAKTLSTLISNAIGWQSNQKGFLEAEKNNDHLLRKTFMYRSKGIEIPEVTAKLFKVNTRGQELEMPVHDGFASFSNLGKIAFVLDEPEEVLMTMHDLSGGFIDKEHALLHDLKDYRFYNNYEIAMVASYFCLSDMRDSSYGYAKTTVEDKKAVTKTLNNLKEAKRIDWSTTFALTDVKFGGTSDSLKFGYSDANGQSLTYQFTFKDLLLFKATS